MPRVDFNLANEEEIFLSGSIAEQVDNIDIFFGQVTAKGGDDSGSIATERCDDEGIGPFLNAASRIDYGRANRDLAPCQSLFGEDCSAKFIAIPLGSEGNSHNNRKVAVQYGLTARLYIAADFTDRAANSRDDTRPVV